VVRLAAPLERVHPDASDLEAESPQRRVVHGHPIILDVPANHASEPIALLGNGLVRVLPELGFHLAQLRQQPLADRLPKTLEPSVAPLSRADMLETGDLRLPLAAPLSPPRGWRGSVTLDPMRLSFASCRFNRCKRRSRCSG
jgi:hypothetical protein